MIHKNNIFLIKFHHNDCFRMLKIIMLIIVKRMLDYVLHFVSKPTFLKVRERI